MLGLDLRFTEQGLFSFLIPVCGAEILHKQRHTAVRLHKHKLWQNVPYTVARVAFDVRLIPDKTEKEKMGKHEVTLAHKHTHVH